MIKHFLMTKMILIVLCFCNQFGFAADVAGVQSGPEKIKIGLTAGGNPEALKKESIFFAETLQNMIHIPIEIYISKNYDGLSEAVRTSKVDYAFLTALTYVETDKVKPLKVLLKKTWSNPYYFSALISLKSKNIKKIKDIKKLKIAFVDRKSTSGYLYPLVYLKDQKITENDFKQIIFSGSHSASVELLESEKVDVIAVFSDDEKSKIGAWTRFGKLPKSKYHVLWTSDPIPNDPFVVQSDFYDKYPKISHDIMYNLIEMQNDPLIRKKINEVIGTGDLMPATSKQYDPVRAMNKLLTQ